MSSFMLPGIIFMVIGAVSSALLFSGELIWGIAFTIIGLTANYLLVRHDEKRHSFEDLLKDKPLY